jgi:serine protease Do
LACAAVAACKGRATPEPEPAVQPTATPIAASEGIPSDFVALARSMDPSVVTIRTSAVVRNARRLPPWLAEQPVEAQIALGSGFIVDPRGLVVTNEHVVEGGTDILVRLASGVDVPAQVIGHDDDLDVALLRIDVPRAPGLVAATLGDSDDLAVGEWIIAIGNPFGLDHTVTAGIVSAVERTLKDGSSGQRSGKSSIYASFIQTDASINPGNSGGPIVNTAGQVVGIALAIDARGGGIGFAVPINMVKAILPALERDGHAERSFLGVFLAPVTDESAAGLGLGERRGVLVTNVIDGSPAARAGVQRGDVIVEYEGRPANLKSLPWRTSLGGPGKKVKAKLWRNGKEREVEVTLGRLPG